MAVQHLAGRVPWDKTPADGFLRTAPGQVVPTERLRTLRHGGQRLGVVQRLVPARLLRRKPAPQPDRSGQQFRSKRAEPGAPEAGDPRRFIPVQRRFLFALQALWSRQGRNGKRPIPHRVPLRQGRELIALTGQFLQQVHHLDGGESGLGALVARLTTCAVDCLLHRFTGQDAEDYRHSTVQSSTDRMVLGFRGQMSEMELDTSIHRMQAGRVNKAQRGEF